jgi:prepilin-type N-terminal cleavage/methylation domain-containing protein
MRQRLRAARANQSGFTLIELLIVIVILGILAGIVVFAVNAFNDKGAVAACRTDRKTLETAVEAYFADKGGYPAGATSDVRIGLLVTGVPSYLKEAPPKTNYLIQITDDNGTITANLAGC